MKKISYISLMSNKVKKYGGINLAQGIPGFSPPVELLEILSDISKENIHQYAPGNGNGRLIKLIMDKYKGFNEDNIMIVNGATEAVSLIFTYLSGVMEKGKKVLGFDPVYESYSRLPEIFGREFRVFPTSETGRVDLNELELFVKKENIGVIFLNSPGNPLGTIWTEEEMRELKSIAERIGVYVIADSVYSEIYFSDPPFQPVFDSEYFFYVNSFSKLLSITGWRIGYFICSADHMSKIRLIHDYTGLCAPSILQEAVAQYLEKYDFGKEYVADLRKKIKRSFLLLHDIILDCGFTFPHIDGGYFIWAKLPEKLDDGLKFSMDLYESKKVATVPGIHFSDNGQKWVRFNIARPEDEIIEAGKRIKEFIAEN
ncbi:MAG: pyridoxal phosphate-dependent aminotransferase [Candidatus Delongbacteria bacterium]|nr:pyridoxal phosphate-dependent aminotransferase [Candidatus Delongbacteria bacterium]MCG2759850.1 pyridoxal phosphate-dependent aminotransferase [Candidatus Delongbacteria bacterium]